MAGAQQGAVSRQGAASGRGVLSGQRGESARGVASARRVNGVVSAARDGRRPGGGGQRRPVRIPSRGGLPPSQVIEIQRSRLLAGAVGAIEEHGFANTTVAQITARARVSRRTFYELFENREACLEALIEDAVAIVQEEIAAADLEGLAWRERIRGGLWVILCFCDREPALARVCVVHSLRGGPAVLARREEVLARLAGVLDEGRGESARGAGCTPLTAEGLVGAAYGILHARLSRGEGEPLSELLGELMGMIALPYLGAAAARREQARPAPAAVRRHPPGLVLAEEDPLQGLPMRLTYRTARVLECIERRPGVSNRAVSDHAGISDQGQVSKLLARLERLGLVVNGSEGHTKGEPNAWELTAKGVLVTQSIRAHAGNNREVA